MSTSGTNICPRGAARRKGHHSSAGAANVLPPPANMLVRSTISQGSNLSVAITSQPRNDSELQLYRVLQRANLLSYYDTFIAQGGDDVHQLCEAGEEEFLEIMALVGMASKPLHVRRLQKTLQEWVQHPGLFLAPLLPPFSVHNPASNTPMTPSVIRGSTTSTPPPMLSSSNDVSLTSAPVASVSQSSTLERVSINNSVPSATTRASATPSPVSSTIMSLVVGSNSMTSTSPALKDIVSNSTALPASPAVSTSAQVDYPPNSTSPLSLTPILVEGQIKRIAETASALIQSLPPSNFEPKFPSNKKKTSKELEGCLSLPDEDPVKMEEIRRLSAIYGRFDCKRKPEKPLTLHEVSVNEASAQLCLRMPSLLARRDELFPLARQVVRDSGYQYSKGHSRSQFANTSSASSALGKHNGGINSNSGAEDIKRQKTSEFHAEDLLYVRRKERCDQIGDELQILSERSDELRDAYAQARSSGEGITLHRLAQQLELVQAKQTQLIMEQQEHAKALRIRLNPGRPTNCCSDQDTDDTDSQISYSNTSSPSAILNLASGVPQHVGNYVLSASGGQIIAVQNPALNLSSSNALIRNSESSDASSLLNLSMDRGDENRSLVKQEAPSSSPTPTSSTTIISLASVGLKPKNSAALLS